MKWDEDNKTIKRNLEDIFDEVLENPQNYFSYDLKLRGKVLNKLSSSYFLTKEFRKSRYLAKVRDSY